MKKLINNVDTVLAESLDGFAVAHADIGPRGTRSMGRRPRMAWVSSSNTKANRPTENGWP